MPRHYIHLLLTHEVESNNFLIFVPFFLQCPLNRFFIIFPLNIVRLYMSIKYFHLDCKSIIFLILFQQRLIKDCQPFLEMWCLYTTVSASHVCCIFPGALLCSLIPAHLIIFCWLLIAPIFSMSIENVGRLSIWVNLRVFSFLITHHQEGSVPPEIFLL